MQKTSSSAFASPTVVRARSTSALFAIVSAAGCVILALAGYVQPVVMGVVQGLGEFLPISSSAHLILVPWFFGWQGGLVDSLTFDIALHLGTLVALVVYFWRDWVMLLRSIPGLAGWALGWARGDRSSSLGLSERILVSVAIATVPAGVLGLMLEEQIERNFRTPLLIAATLTILGVVLYIADRWQPEQRSLEQLTLRDALLVGLAQACALVPGVSRSGATITMGRVLRFDRATAARYSFLLSAPITGAAVLFKLDELVRISPAEVDDFVVGVLVSGVVGALAIHFLLSYVRRVGFGVFALYRLLVAAAIILVYASS